MRFHPTRLTHRDILGGVAALLVLAGGSTGVAIAVGASSTMVTKTYGSGANAKTVHRVLARGPSGIQGVNAPAPEESSPAALLPANTPIPVPPAVLQVSNAWKVSNGNELVAVYAGRAGNDPSTGRFVIVRQSPSGGQTVSIIDVPGAGALSITSPPQSTTGATNADIPYTAASGSSGTLHLANNTATRDRR